MLGRPHWGLFFAVIGRDSKGCRPVAKGNFGHPVNARKGRQRAALRAKAKQSAPVVTFFSPVFFCGASAQCGAQAARRIDRRKTESLRPLHLPTDPPAKRGNRVKTESLRPVIHTSAPVVFPSPAPRDPDAIRRPFFNGLRSFRNRLVFFRHICYVIYKTEGGST